MAKTPQSFGRSGCNRVKSKSNVKELPHSEKQTGIKQYFQKRVRGHLLRRAEMFVRINMAGYLLTL